MTTENKSLGSESERENLEISGEELHVLLYGMLDKLIGLWQEDTGLDPSNVTLDDFIDWASRDLRRDLQVSVVLDSHDLDPLPDPEIELKPKPASNPVPEFSGAAGLSAYDPNKPRRRRPGKPRGGGFSSR